MSRGATRFLATSLTCAGLLIGPTLSRSAGAQMTHTHAAPKDSVTARRGSHGSHEHVMPGAPAHRYTMPTTPAHRHAMPGMPTHGHATSSHHHEMQMTMNGMYGPYPMTREASGTAWQPDAAAHRGIHVMRGPWMAMIHGYADLVYDRQDGARGDEKVFSSNMAMGMAQRSLGPGTLGLRTMLSLEPATTGKEGYPLLLQTGETANGRTPLVDRQHPHDLFMELAGSYSLARGNRSVFLYGGLPGEPALGPPAFMHRFSGVNVPVAPITHHWLDSTHITYGVLTAGAVVDRVKVEASAFRGREPDQDRWNIEAPKLDSHSFRLSFNPSERWALQVSYGRLESPEQLEPQVDQDRTTASATREGSWRDWHWEGTLAWGRNRNRPGHILDALSAEAAAELAERHTLFARVERVEKDELFLEPDPRAGRGFDVGEVTAGYRYDFWRREHLAAGIGGAGTLAQIPRALRDVYGKGPASAMIFAHVGLQ
jgi:hypothetical protein